MFAECQTSESLLGIGTSHSALDWRKEVVVGRVQIV